MPITLDDKTADELRDVLSAIQDDAQQLSDDSAKATTLVKRAHPVGKVGAAFVDVLWDALGALLSSRILDFLLAGLTLRFISGLLGFIIFAVAYVILCLVHEHVDHKRG